MDKKLTDSEIVKALENEIHLAEYVDSDYCSNTEVSLLKSTLDLINRLQEGNERLQLLFESVINSRDGYIKVIEQYKAENERLKTENKLLIDNDVSNKYPNCVLVEKGRIYTKTLEDYDNLIGDISAEAYKEFAEKIKKWKYQSSDWSHGEHPFVIEESDIDEVLEELVGDNNAKSQNECV